MRVAENEQMMFGQMDISKIKLDPKSRDDIPQLLRGLQHIYVCQDTREGVFDVLETMIPDNVSKKTGRPGMELWKILVMGVLRLNLDWDYDRLQEMVNHHITIRQMLGHGILDNDKQYNHQTLNDNISLFTPEILGKINEIVVRAGHKLVKKKDEILKGKCDSFVVETDVHYPTDINLLFDAVRKVIELSAELCAEYGRTDWRQSKHHVNKVKQQCYKIQNLKRSKAKNSDKKSRREDEIREAHSRYIGLAADYLEKSDYSLQDLDVSSLLHKAKLDLISHYKQYAEKFIDQIERRVLLGETIAHDEKIFSVFEPHTEWISKGKAGVPFELGLNVCILMDQFGFTLHHQVMRKIQDVDIAVPMVEAAQSQFPGLAECSFDKGFYSPSNSTKLRNKLDHLVLPKKGKLSSVEKDIENSEKFLLSRRKHSAVESGINALEQHGLDRCPDKGIEAFERYVSLAVLARNIQTLGAVMLKREKKKKAGTQMPKSRAA